MEALKLTRNKLKLVAGALFLIAGLWVLLAGVLSATVAENARWQNLLLAAFALPFLLATAYYWSERE